MASTATEGPVTMSRPIERLPVRRLSNEPKEAMNCKSCRKRKIKCNRLKPSCEACQVFKVECVYDAIPKKRGPKTDVLEALLKRVNGLEKRLKDENKSVSPPDAAEEQAVVETTATVAAAAVASATSTTSDSANDQQQQDHPDTVSPSIESPIAVHVPRPTTTIREPTPRTQPTPMPQYNYALLDVYFGRLHGKPYHILDEIATRQRWQAGQLPVTILNAIHAVTAKYAQHLVGGQNAAARLSEECAARARTALDSDEPTVENIQTSLLLAIAFFQSGKGKKSYMLLSSAISMALALGLHRELPATLRISPTEREGRRKLFWTCYSMDRFTAAGSKRPSLIADECIGLRLPAWPSDLASSVPYEGNYFTNGNSMPVSIGPGGRVGQSAGAMLVETVRILGTTNRYLAAGGVKGDSHFPWHAQSNLSRIRQDLDFWAANNQEAFLPIESISGQQDHMTTVLAKLIYHLIHCLIYRPFLPVDLQELAETGQYQSWQIEATNLCFLHANAIAELSEAGKATTSPVDWPSFASYCLCTAGTVHVHGVHYAGREGDIFARSAEFLSREMAQLNDMRAYVAGIQHQRGTLQTVYGCHSQLVKALATNPMRFSPVFQMEDFFDRYPGGYIDGAQLTFSDVPVESAHESLPAYDGLNAQSWNWKTQHTQQQMNTTAMMPPPPRSVLGTTDGRPKKKRRRTQDATALNSNTASKNNIQDLHSDPSPEAQPTNHQPIPQLATPSQTHTTIPDPTESTDATNDPHLFSHNPFSPTFSLSPWPLQFTPEHNMPSTYNPDPTQNLDLTFDPHNNFPSNGGSNNNNANSFSHYHSNNAFSYNISGSLGSSFGAGAGGPTDIATPGGLSANGSALSENERDPFLNLLEQLAENEHGRGDGPSDLDFFLSSQT